MRTIALVAVLTGAELACRDRYDDATWPSSYGRPS
jgi:hypothetical protein